MQITRKLTIKHYIIIGSMLFGMFFGAGNLIFPIHLGQLAGGQLVDSWLGILADRDTIATVRNYRHQCDAQ